MILFGHKTGQFIKSRESVVESFLDDKTTDMESFSRSNILFHSNKLKEKRALENVKQQGEHTLTLFRVNDFLRVVMC